jgi:uncharacterized protein YqgC (DUF456 family)
MIEMGQSILLLVAGASMLIALVLAFVPMMPGALLVWGVGIAFGFVEGWQRVTVASGIVMSLLMVVAVSSDFWLPLMGVKTGGLTCLGAVGGLVGGLFGTIFIPIPVVGTLLGSVIGTLAVELIRFRQLHKALQAGQTAAKMFALGYVIEVGASAAIAATFFISLLTSG